MEFSVTIFGSGAAVPTRGRHCSSQMIIADGYKMLVDCGEGTQNQMFLYYKRLRQLNTIFISHLHGDHWFGLPGLLSSMHLGGRTEPLDVYGPQGLKKVLDSVFSVSGSAFQYELRIHEIAVNEPETIFENDKCKVTAFPLQHSVPTYGFIFEEAEPELNLKKTAREKYGLGDADCRNVKAGADFVMPNGTVIPNAEMTLPRRKARRYAYCCDTGYFDGLLDIVRQVDMLCLESTFDNKYSDLAAEKGHLTALQAAQIAKQSDVGQLLLTHFSARYKGGKIEVLVHEAKSVFENVVFAEDGKRYEIATRNSN